MHDLNTIRRVNAEAVQRAVIPQLAAGKHAVIQFTGVNYYDASIHDTKEQAQAHAERLRAEDEPGLRIVVVSPDILG